MLAPGGSDICHLYPIPCYFEETNQNRYSKEYVKRQTKKLFFNNIHITYILSCKKCICQEIILGDCIKKLGRFGVQEGHLDLSEVPVSRNARPPVGFLAGSVR